MKSDNRAGKMFYPRNYRTNINSTNILNNLNLNNQKLSANANSVGMRTLSTAPISGAQAYLDDLKNLAANAANLSMIPSSVPDATLSSHLSPLRDTIMTRNAAQSTQTLK